VSIQKIDGKRLSQMIIQGANNLTNNVQLVDALNVFPVPDGWAMKETINRTKKPAT